MTALATGDRVDARLREAVIDFYGRRCVALLIDPDAGWCRDGSGRLRSAYDLSNLTLDHIQEGYGRTGKRAGKGPGEDVELMLVPLCSFHHIWSPWAVSHRPQIRDFIARKRHLRPHVTTI